MRKIGYGPSCASIRARSSEILAQSGNRFMLIEAICLCFLVMPVYYGFYTMCFVLSATLSAVPMIVWEWLWGAILFFLTLFVTLPLVQGVLGMASDMEQEKAVVLPDVFASFTSRKRYGKALWISWCFLWLPAVIGFVMWASFGLVDALIVNSTLATLLRVAVGFLEGAFGLALLLLRFSKNAALLEDKAGFDESEAPKKSKPTRRLLFGVRFWASYFLRILMGILSIGILLLMDVIPEMLLSYFQYCKTINDNDDPIGGEDKNE